MSSYRSSTSALAARSRPGPGQVDHNRVPHMLDWDTYYFPETMFYLRRLDQSEVDAVVGQYTDGRYGVIDSRGERIVAVDRYPSILFLQARGQEVRLVYVQ